jgi:hypothetical protein
MTQDMTLTTVQEVDLYYTQAKRHCDQWHRDILHRRQLYDGNHYLIEPRQGEERYVDPTYTNVVDLCVGIILANDLDFKVHGWSPSDEEQRKSEQVEKFLAGLLQVNSDRMEIYIPYEVLLNFTRDGTGVVFTGWDDNLAARLQISTQIVDTDEDGLPAAKSVSGFREPPVVIDVVDLMNIFMIPGEIGRWSHIMRVEQYTVADVETRFGVKIKRYAHLRPSEKATQKGELIDYWRISVIFDGETLADRTTVEHALVYEGTEIWELREEPNYEDLPFTIGFFKPTDQKSGAGWGKSIIDPLESTISMMERAFNRRHYQVTRFAGLPLVMEIQPGRTLNIDSSYGNVVQINPGESVGFPQWQGNPPDVELEMQFLRSRAQQSGFSDVLFGAGVSSVSGYGLSQLGDQNRIRLEQPVQHLQAFWSRWAKKTLRLVEKKAAGMVVRVYGRMRGKEFMDQVFDVGLSDYNVMCEIKPEFPNEKVRKHAMATQVRGILSDYTIMQEYLDIEQPGDEQERRLLEMAQNHPITMQYGMMKKLREMAEAGDQDAAAVLQQMQTQGLPGQQPGPEKDPRKPEQLMGTPSPTGQETPQAQGQMPPGQSEMDMMQNLAGTAPQMNM